MVEMLEEQVDEMLKEQVLEVGGEGEVLQDQIV